MAFGQSGETYIENTAKVSYDFDGTPSEINSNTVYIALRHLIDVEVVAEQAQADPVNGDDADYSYGYVVTNPGNRSDMFELVAAFTDSVTPVSALWVDVDGNGRLDPAIDRPINPSNPEITLPAGGRVRILVRAPEAGTVRLTATSLTDDPQAVVRHRSASDAISMREPRLDTVTLTKSQSVNGANAETARRGSLVTYSLVANIPANSGLSDIRVSDVVPEGTTYVPGSLLLNAVSLSDGPDADAGHFDATTRTLDVVLPEATTVSLHTVQFQVRIN